jgi:hypothetical protein
MDVALVVAALWIVAFVMAQVCLVRCVAPRRRFKATLAVLGLAVAGNSLSVLAALVSNSATARALLNLFYADLALLCAFIVYMPFYYTIAASLSVQTMITLEAAPHGNTPLTLLQRQFASLSILEGRLESMAANGYLTRSGACYRLTGKGRVTARVFQWFKKCWRLGPGG